MEGGAEGNMYKKKGRERDRRQRYRKEPGIRDC